MVLTLTFIFDCRLQTMELKVFFEIISRFIIIWLKIDDLMEKNTAYYHKMLPFLTSKFGKFLLTKSLTNFNFRFLAY